jgi:hypothetical protein
MKSVVSRQSLVLFFAAIASAIAPCSVFAKTFDWRLNAPVAKAETFTAYHGETIRFNLVFFGAMSNVTAEAIYYQTNGMAKTDWFHVPGTVFHPTNDCGAAAYRFFIKCSDPDGRDYTANGTLRLLDSPGFEPSAIELPAKVLDFAEVEVENAPWPAEIEAAIAEIPTPDLSDYATHGEVEEAIAGITETDPVWEAEKADYITYSDWHESWEPILSEADARSLENESAIGFIASDIESITNEFTYTAISNTVTKAYVEDLGIKPSDPSYSWLRPDAWTIDVEIDKSEQQGAVTVIDEETDTAGRVWSNETYIATFGMAAKCSAALLDESSLNIPQIESWSALPPGGTIDSSGHFTAATSGLYRVSATATDGTTRYADVAISAERTVTNSNVRTYMADAVGGLRKSLNDDGLADLEGANLVSSNRYGTTWYTVYDIEPPRWSEPGGWVFHPFAIAPRILATCAHGIWDGRDGLYESHTFSNALGTTYTLLCNLHWVILRDWALTNGFTAAEAAAVDDLAVNFATYVPRGTGDTDTGIDPSILPSFFTPESFERRLGGDAMGLIGWHQGQDHAQPFPISFAQQNFQNWGPPSRWSAVLRRDICARLVAMDFLNYPLHGGDSGRPVFLRSSTLGDIVVAHHTSVMACRADYIAGYKIIKAFAAAHGQTLKEVE